MPSQGKDKRNGKEAHNEKCEQGDRPRVDMKKQMSAAELRVLLEKFMELDNVQQKEIVELKEKLMIVKKEAKESAEKMMKRELNEMSEKLKKMKECNAVLLSRCENEKNAKEEFEKKWKEAQWLADKRGAQRDLMACKIDTPLIMMEKDKLKLQKALNNLQQVEQDRDKWRSMLEEAREVFQRERAEAKDKEEERNQTGGQRGVEEEMQEVWNRMK